MKTRSKAVEHALGCVATKIGFCDMVVYADLCGTELYSKYPYPSFASKDVFRRGSSRIPPDDEGVGKVDCCKRTKKAGTICSGISQTGAKSSTSVCVLVSQNLPLFRKRFRNHKTTGPGMYESYKS